MTQQAAPNQIAHFELLASSFREIAKMSNILGLAPQMHKA